MKRIHAICLVKNEGDVIAETLRYASKFCHKIYVFDTGSTDDSWQQVEQAASDVIIPFRHESIAFYDGLRAQVFNAVRGDIAAGDWLYILDADEFLAADPCAAIEIAEKEGAQQIDTLQYNFQFTDVDWQQSKKGLDSRDRSIIDRRRYYCFTNIEQRLFQVDTDTFWPEHTDVDNPHGFMRPQGARKLKKCTYRLPNCHYQYRDPEQIRLRMQTRKVAREINPKIFIHNQSLDSDMDWQQYIVPSQQMNYYNKDGEFKIRLGERVTLFQWRFQDLISKARRRLISLNSPA